MVEYAQPFDGASYTEGDWQRMARHWLASGVVSGYLNQLAVSAGTGMTVNVASGAAWAVGFLYETTATVTTTLAAAHASLPRVDRVVVRLDRTANTFTVANLTGTAASSPTAPALTQTDTVYEVPLATIAVAAATGSIVAGNITDGRVFTGDARLILQSLVDAKGDLLVATAADTVGRLAAGSTGLALVSDPGTATGLAWVQQYNPASYPPPLSRAVMSTTETSTGLFNTSGYVLAGCNVSFIAGPAGTALIDCRAAAYINSGNSDPNARFGYELYNVTAGTVTIAGSSATTVGFEVHNQSAGDQVMPAVAWAFPVSGLTSGSTYTARTVGYGTGGWYAISQQVIVHY